MGRSTIVVGNGLGMALDPNFFNLDSALDEIWKMPNCLTAIQKDQIRHCINAQGINDQPHSEDHLDVLHVAVMACKFLDGIGSPNVTWLSNDGQTFPIAIEKFISSTAWHFHHYPGTLPKPFVDGIVDYLDQTKSHIATLNYDNLLYQKLIENQILRGYSGKLLDGFYASGFDADNLVRKYGRTFGYYLHLHGSPLFIDVNGTPIKQAQGFANENISTPHIVLAHVKHKTSVIANSYLLRTYWQYLDYGLKESDKIILFGYSGEDIHLNQIIAANIPTRGIEENTQKKVIVVEWSGAGTLKNRKSFWNKKLDISNVNLIQMPNILDFQDWNNA